MRIRYFVFAILAFVARIAVATPLVTISPDKSTYIEGERAFLHITLSTAPNNAGDEYFFEAQFAGDAQKVVVLGAKEAVAVTNPFNSDVTRVFQLKTYLQNKQRAESYLATIHYYKTKNVELQSLLDKETDSTRIGLIQSQITRNTSLITEARQKLSSGRTLLNTSSVTLVLDTISALLKPRFFDPILTVTPDHSTPLYLVGEDATFNVEASGATSDTELVLKGVIPSNFGRPEISFTRTAQSDGTFDFKSPTFVVPDAGKRQFVIQGGFRSKAESDYYRGLARTADSKKREYIALRNKTQDEMKKQYYQMLIDELSTSTGYFRQKLDDLVTPITTPAYAFRIKDPSLVIGFEFIAPEDPVVEKGEAVFGLLRLNYQPDSDITVSFVGDGQVESGSTLTFTSENWNVFQEIEILAVDDEVLEGPHTGELEISGSGPDYTGVTMSSGEIQIEDQEYPYANISAGPTSVCASKAGHLVCWGSNSEGELGISGSSRSIPTFIPGFTAVTKISSGEGHRCIINNEAMYCWGRNSSGQIGLGTTSTSELPTAVPGMGSDVTEISVGGNHTCAIKAGTLYCWGQNTYGQIGDGTVVDKLSPTSITLSENALVVSSAFKDTCVNLEDGTLWCWGDNTYGQLGNGTTTPSTTPVQASISPGEYKLSEGSMSSTRCVSEDPVQFCVGLNSSFQFGFSEFAGPYYTEYQFFDPGIRRFDKIAFGSIHGCSKDEFGVRCFGSVGNNDGLIGNGNNQGSDTRAEIATWDEDRYSGLITVSSNIACTVVTQSDPDTKQNMYCWGSSTMLGNNSGLSSNVPVKVLDPVNL